MKRQANPIGELVLIEQIRRASRLRNASVVLGIGDDCAILRPPPGCELLITTDFSLEGRHFRRDRHPAESVGHRCLARGLSDLAAMGAKPLAAFLSLALPRDIVTTKSGQQWTRRFLHGLHALGVRYACPLAGGATAESPSSIAGAAGTGLIFPGLILADIILVGAAPSGKALRRSGARPGDLLYCTGSLGGAAAELATVLARNSMARIRSGGTAGANAALHPHLLPEPRLATGAALLRRKLATAALDISDGLSTDLMHLCVASGVHAVVDVAALPIHPLAAALGPAPALHAALHGGEDYELLFTAAASTRMPRSLAGVPITPIGRITRRRTGQPVMTLLHPDGTRQPLEPAGWEHFSSTPH